MQLMLEAEKLEFGVGEVVTIRLLALNNSYAAEPLDRRLLVGPNPVPEHAVGAPFPVSLEPAFPEEERNKIMLNPWCFYGREHSFETLPSGHVTIYAYLLDHPVDSLLPQGPGDSNAVLVSAPPLVVTVR